MTKDEKSNAVKKSSTPIADQPVPESNLPLVSMILGIVSLTTFMFFLGLPALITGLIGLKKHETNRGFSITGIVTGAISTLITIIGLFLIMFVIFAAVIDSSHQWSAPEPRPYQGQFDDFPMERDGREGV